MLSNRDMDILSSPTVIVPLNLSLLDTALNFDVKEITFLRGRILFPNLLIFYPYV
jgi:hypothetical protein